MTPEEKKEVLTNELERWIKGMMEACGGSVTAWDVVNEPISGGGDDGNGNYALQSATNPDDNGVGGQNFYWQDFWAMIMFVFQLSLPANICRKWW